MVNGIRSCNSLRTWRHSVIQYKRTEAVPLIKLLPTEQRLVRQLQGRVARTERPNKLNHPDPV